MLASELKAFTDIIDDYIEHLEKTKNKSLLARIYGIFRIKTRYFATLIVIVMQNTSKFLNKHKMKYHFDIKGSLVNRRVNFDVYKAFGSSYAVP